MDKTENIRREMTIDLNNNALGRADLELKYGQVWDNDELTKDFSVLSFAAPFILVESKATYAPGVLRFQDRPRFYFDFEPT